MKGQSSAESLIALAGILVVISVFLYTSTLSTGGINALDAARTGAENAIGRTAIKNGASMQVTGLSRNDDNIKIQIEYWGGQISEESLKDNVRADALEFIHQAFNGNFPENEISNVSTKHHTFVVSVEVNEVTK